jgi:hypothetical protein
MRRLTIFGSKLVPAQFGFGSEPDESNEPR